MHLITGLQEPKSLLHEYTLEYVQKFKKKSGERQIETDRQRQTDRQINRQTDKQTDRQTDIYYNLLDNDSLSCLAGKVYYKTQRFGL